MTETKLHMCWNCGDDVADKRWALGYRLCLWCGEELARERKHCIVPLNKSNYIAVTDPAMLKQLNPKRSAV